MTTWRDFQVSSLAAPPPAARTAPPFRGGTAAALQAAHAARAVTDGACHISDDPSGADRLRFPVPSRLQFGGSSWPLPQPAPLRDAALTLHLGDLYARPRATEHGPAPQDAFALAPACAAGAGAHSAERLRAAVHAWLLAERGAGAGAGGEGAGAERELVQCSEAATPGDWVLVLQQVAGASGRGLLVCATQQRDGGELGRLLDVCPGLGDCILGHALPSLLCETVQQGSGGDWRRRQQQQQQHAQHAGAAHLGQPVVHLLGKAFQRSTWRTCAPIEIQQRLIRLGLSSSRLPHACAVEALLMELSAAAN